MSLDLPPVLIFLLTFCWSFELDVELLPVRTCKPEDRGKVSLVGSDSLTLQQVSQTKGQPLLEGKFDSLLSLTSVTS